MISKSLWFKQRSILKKKRASSKFGAKRTGDGFPSKLEASVYQILLTRERSGEIKEIRRQHRVDLIARVSWKIDFSAVDVATGETFFIEAKGIETSDFKIKKKLFKEFGKGRLEIWKGDYRKPRLAETIFPLSLTAQGAPEEALNTQEVQSPKKRTRAQKIAEHTSEGPL